VFEGEVVDPFIQDNPVGVLEEVGHEMTDRFVLLGVLQVFEILLEVHRDDFLLFGSEVLFHVALDLVIDPDDFVQLQGLEFLLALFEVALEQLGHIDRLLLFEIALEGAGGFRPHEGGDHLAFDRVEGATLEGRNGFRDGFPGAARGSDVHGVLGFNLIPVQPFRFSGDEVDHAFVDPALGAPGEPFVHGGLEDRGSEAVQQGLVEVLNGVAVPDIRRGDDHGTFRQLAVDEFLVEGEVHHHVQDFGTTAVDLVQEEAEGLVFLPPSGREEVHDLGLGPVGESDLLLAGKTDEVTRVAHLTEEERDHLVALRFVKLRDNLALAEAVAPEEQKVAGLGHVFQGEEEFLDVDSGDLLRFVHGCLLAGSCGSVLPRSWLGSYNIISF